MSESYIKIGADGVDAEEIVREIQQRADERRRNGEFDVETVARAERYNLSNVKDNADFFDRYISCLRLVTQVDINDFEILERRAKFGFILKRLKLGIWKLLRFYTFRLWSQQNQVNSMFHAAIEVVAKRDSEQLAKMQRRIDELEERLAKLEK